MKSARALLTRLGVFAVVMLLLLFAILQAIHRPLTGDTDPYTAQFTDANGLKHGDDVRLFGVRVGTVDGLTLNGNNIAEVRFSLERQHPLATNSTLAIRYQNLTGQRYLDIQEPPNPAGRAEPGTTIGTDHTTPAFDITTLFNGLQPVLAELTPGDLNQFATSLLAVIEGSGSDLAPALGAIETLSRYAVDRQSVISALVANLGQVAEHLGGRSGHAVALLTQLTDLFGTLQEKADGLVDFALTIPPVLVPADSLLATLGLTPDANPDLDNAIRNLFPDPAQTVDVLNRLPGLLQSLSAAIPRPGAGVNIACSRGQAPTPEVLQVFIGGQRVSLCNN